MAKISDLQEGPEREKLTKQFGADADVMEVAKGFLNARDKLSSTRRVPDADSPAEDWGKLYDHLGRPASADDYQLPDAPDSLKPTLEKLRTVAYEKGLSQDQFAALASQAGQVNTEADSKLAEARTAWEQKIREEHGDKADDRMAKAKSAMDTMMADDPMTAGIIERFGLDKHPALMNAFLRANNAMNDDATPGAGSSPGADTSGPSANELFKEGMELMRSDAYKQGERHPENALAQARMTEINEVLVRLGYQKGIADDAFRRQPVITLPDGRQVRIR